MGEIAFGNPWLIELCKAFGENPAETRKIVLTVDVDATHIASVVIEKIVDSENEGVIEIIRKVAWVEEESNKESDAK